MEDIKPPQPSQNPTPVMDIQPNRINPNEQPMAGHEVPKTISVSEQSPLPLQSTASSNEPTEATPQDALKPAPLPITNPTQHKSYRAPILAILCAIIISGVFAALAVMVYVSNTETQPQADSNQQPTTNSTQETPATAEDVTETDKAIDDSLSGANDATDYNDADVSDTTLGL